MKKMFEEVPHLTGDRIILKKLEASDAMLLDRMRHNENVYRFLPTFLFENKYEDIDYTIRMIYEECFQNRESIIMGIYLKDDMRFAGLAEIYGVNDAIRKVSIGHRLAEEEWGKGFATETVRLLVDYLYGETDIEIITASTMIDNKASENVLRKNDFILTSTNIEEDWGYDKMTIADKWCR